MSVLGDRPIPAQLIGQYLGKLEASAAASTAPDLLHASVERGPSKPTPAPPAPERGRPAPHASSA